MGFIEVLTLILIVLKFLKVISASWLVVLSPILGFYLVFLLFIAVASSLGMHVTLRRTK